MSINRSLARTAVALAVVAVVAVPFVHGGSIEVNNQARYTEACGAEFTLSDGVATYLETDSPQSETEYHARFYLDLGGVVMSSGEAFDVFAGLDGSSTAQFRVEIFESGGDKYVTGYALDGGVESQLPSNAMLKDGWHALTVSWLAGNGTGVFELSVDGNVVGTLSSLSNESSVVTLARLGAVDGLDAGTIGSTFYVDDFMSTRNSDPDLSSVYGDFDTAYWAWPYITSMYGARLIDGCNLDAVLACPAPVPGLPEFCPKNKLTRAQIARFISMGKNGATFTPPTPSGIFDDVDVSYWGAPWIEYVYGEGIIEPCGTTTFCPKGDVLRGEVTKFLLLGEHGSGYTPPAATGTVFNDVPVSFEFAPWIEQAVAEGIVDPVGCGGGNFCPNNRLTRAQVSRFVTETFDVPVVAWTAP